MMWNDANTNTDVVVTVVWIVVVAIGAARVVSIVVERAAAQDASSSGKPFVTNRF